MRFALSASVVWSLMAAACARRQVTQGKANPPATQTSPARNPGQYATIPIRRGEQKRALTIGARKGKFPGIVRQRASNRAHVVEPTGGRGAAGKGPLGSQLRRPGGDRSAEEVRIPASCQRLSDRAWTPPCFTAESIWRRHCAVAFIMAESIRRPAGVRMTRFARASELFRRRRT
jgi:hypothetical protein